MSTDLHVCELRIGRTMLAWLNDHLEVAWSRREADLLKRLNERPRYRDGSVRIKLDQPELSQMKTWAAWALHVSSKTKGELGEGRSLWNSAKGLIKRIQEVEGRTRA